MRPWTKLESMLTNKLCSREQFKTHHFDGALRLSHQVEVRRKLSERHHFDLSWYALHLCSRNHHRWILNLIDLLTVVKKKCHKLSLSDKFLRTKFCILHADSTSSGSSVHAECKWVMNFSLRQCLTFIIYCKCSMAWV